MRKIIFFSALSIIQVNYASEIPTQPVGLRNLGNTCYLNSVVQCLLPSESFRNTVLSYKPQPGDKEEDRQLTLSLQSLIREIQASPDAPIYPNAFVDLSNECTFGLAQKGKQQDAEEYFVQLIDHLYPKKIKDLFAIEYSYKKIYNGIEVNNQARKISNLNIPYDYLPPEKRRTGMPIEVLVKSFFSVPKTAIVEGADLAGIKGSYPMREENGFIGASDILVVTAPRVNELLEKHTIPFWSSQQQFIYRKKMIQIRNIGIQ